LAGIVGWVRSPDFWVILGDFAGILGVFARVLGLKFWVRFFVLNRLLGSIAQFAVFIGQFSGEGVFGRSPAG
jgi:hypothetical protein